MVFDTDTHPLWDVFPKTPTRDVIKNFMRYLILGVCLLLVTAGAIAWLEFQRVGTIREEQEISDLKLLQFVIRQDLRSLAADLMVLAENDSLAQYLTDPSEELIRELEERYRNFARDRKFYSQVRLIDDKGSETVRVNTMDNESIIVSENLLQNKKNRYYFRDTMILERGEIFISPLDLNLENGQIEIPYTPVLRVGTPVFDEQGVKRGMVMLNFSASLVLGRFETAFPHRDPTSFEMLNKQGYWLRGASSEKEWGFMFKERKILKQENPALWSAIQKKGVGQERLVEGLYSFISFYPEREISKWVKERQIYGPIPDIKKVQEADDSLVWYLVLFTSKEELSLLAFMASKIHLYWIFPLLIIGVSGAALYIALVQSSRERTQRSLRLLSTCVEQSPAAVLLTETDGKIVYANQKFERLTGYDREEIYGQNPRIFKSGTTPESVYKELWKTVLDGNLWRGDFENRRKNNRPYFVSAQIGPVYDKSHNLSGLLAIMEDTTETKQLQEELEKMAKTDGLTGTLNRHHFLQRFSAEAERAARYGHTLTLLAFDLDHFKNINDTYGHHAGDKVLRIFAETVSSGLRSSDSFGRMGGEEFCTLLAQTDCSGGVRFAERLRKEVEALRITCDNNSIKVTVSVGVTEWKESDEDIEGTLIRADRALYESKNGGRNQVTLLTE